MGAPGEVKRIHARVQKSARVTRVGFSLPLDFPVNPADILSAGRPVSNDPTAQHLGFETANGQRGSPITSELTRCGDGGSRDDLTQMTC